MATIPKASRKEPTLPNSVLNWYTVYDWCSHGERSPLKKAIRFLALGNEWVAKTAEFPNCHPRRKFYEAINLEGVQNLSDVVDRLHQAFHKAQSLYRTVWSKEEIEKAYVQDLLYTLMSASDGLEQMIADPGLLQLLHESVGADKSWGKGGCFILAEGIKLFLSKHNCPCRLMAVWETWDMEPDHVLAEIGRFIYLDFEGFHSQKEILTEWGDFVRGGVVLAPISQEQAKMYDIPTNPDLSQRIATFLEECYKKAVEK